MFNDFDKEKIIARIDDIKNSHSELKRLSGISIDDFRKNKENYPLAIYYLRIALESVLTIATHVLSRLPSNGKEKDYTQLILSLADYKVIPYEFAQKIKGMAGYRNRLVHLYWKISDEEVLSIIKENINDFEEFIEYVNEFLRKNSN